MSNLIYHSKEGYDRGESPFDRAIRETADSEGVRIVCPYIGPAYVKSILRDVDEWRIITDVVAWVGAFHGDSREEIREFIEENQDRIHHFPHIHAKVVLSDDSAIVGSANLTEMGVLGRTEMGVRFSEEEKIDELREWFNRRWSESSTVDLEELDELFRTFPSVSSTHPHSTGSLSSDAPQVRASSVEDVESSIRRSIAVEENDDRRMTAIRFVGGVDSRLDNLQSMLEYIADERPDESAIFSWMRNKTTAQSESTIRSYVNFISQLGLIEEDENEYVITDAGEYFRNSEDVDFLYSLLSDKVKGFETILAVLSNGGKTMGQIQALLRGEFPEYSLTTGVIIRHLEWLQSIGYIEKSGEEYQLA